MIFLTVGTYPLQFDRLVRSIDYALEKGLIKEDIFAQIGYCKYKPYNMKFVELLEKEEFDSYFHRASSIISHAGMGSITMALEQNKSLLVMPRLKQYKEHVNDHQLSTAKKFEQLGHILVAYKIEDIEEKINQLKSFIPIKRKVNPQSVADRIARFLQDITI